MLPTLKEGCCNAIVEALACGIPVISSDRPFNDDILDENNSIRVNPENVDAIAAAINKLVRDKACYVSLKKNAMDNSGEHSIVERAKAIIEFINRQVSE